MTTPKQFTIETKTTTHDTTTTTTTISSNSRSTNNNNKLVVEEQSFRVLLEKLGSLLNRLKRKSKEVNTPPDEETSALGKQTAHVFMSMYFASSMSQQQHGHATSTATATATSRRRNRDEWKKQGNIILDLFLENVHHGGRLSSGFFHEIANDSRLLLLLVVGGVSINHGSIRDDDEENVDHGEDLVHWWLQCLTRLNSSSSGIHTTSNNIGQHPLNQSRILAAGIRNYVIFSFGQYYNYSTKLATKRGEENRNGKEIIASDDGRNGTMDHFHLVNLYEKLDGSSGRQFLIRQCVHACFDIILSTVNSTGQQQQQHDNVLDKIIAFSSPLFYRVVVSSMFSCSHDGEDARLFISLILEKIRYFTTIIPASTATTVALNCRNGWIVMMDWLTQTLEVFLISSLDQASLDHVHVALGIGHDFARQLCQVVAMEGILRIGGGGGGGGDAIVKFQHRFLSVFLGRILPRLVKHSTFTVDVPCLDCILENISTIMIRGVNHNGLGGGGVMDALPNVVFYNMSIACCMMQDEGDIARVLEILSLAVNHRQPPCQAQIMVYGVLASVGFVFHSLPSCSEAATKLIHYAKEESLDLLYRQCDDDNDDDDDAAAQQDVLGQDIKQGMDRNQPSHVYDLFCDGISAKTKLESLIHQLGNFEQNLTIENQCESLLLGLALLYTSTKDEPMIKTVISYLGVLIEKYLHLGRRCLPVLVATIQNYISRDHEISSSHEVISSLFELMCSCLAKDPSCAHEVWSILSSMTTETSPINVQGMTVRLYPLLCKSNKRLYSRIHASLSNYISHANASLRIAAAASLCDLAKDDLIRDVSEVIGWVQTFLTDENELVIYFAITTLYHLIVAEELDFSTVIKVLNKKLVPIDDAQAMLQLPRIVVEALVPLMGAGEVGGASDSDDDDSSGDGSGPSEIVISQQVQAAMSGLLNLSLRIATNMLNQNAEEINMDVESNLRILSSLNSSISKYSLERIGLSHEMVRRESQETVEYDMMKQVIEMSFDASEKFMDKKDRNFDMNLIALARKLVLFEEDALGPSLWSYKKKKYSQKTQTCANISAALRAIPESAEGTVTCFLVGKLVERAESALNHPLRLSLSLACLQDLALPSPFVGLLRKTMDTDVGEKEILTGPCVDLLIAQLRITRRAADERREYVKLSIELAQLPSELFFIELWNYAPQFLESLSIIIPQWTSATAEELIPRLWSHCSDKLDGDGVLYATAFLKSLASILELKDKKLSPMMIKAIYKVVITDALPQIGAALRGKLNEPIHTALFNCVSKIPVEVLLEHKIFDLINDEGIRIQLICYLHEQGILQLEDPYLIRAILWVGKEQSTRSYNEELFLWTLSFDLARTATKMPMKARSEILTSLLEIMQVYGVRSTNLHLILLLSSRWVQDYPLIMQSPALFHPSLILGDQKFGKLSLSSRFMKRVLMLLKAISKEGGQERDFSDDDGLKECFFNIFLSLKSSDSSSLHALVSASQVFTSLSAWKFNAKQ